MVEEDGWWKVVSVRANGDDRCKTSVAKKSMEPLFSSLLSVLLSLLLLLLLLLLLSLLLFLY